jgi:hypothetical protein
LNAAAVELHIVEQHGVPALVKGGGAIGRGIAPAAQHTLLAQRLAHRTQQMGLAGAGLAPQVGGHGRARTAALDGHAQMLQGCGIRPAKKAAQRGQRRQTNVKRQLLHAEQPLHTTRR